MTVAELILMGELEATQPLPANDDAERKRLLSLFFDWSAFEAQLGLVHPGDVGDTYDR